MVSLLFKASVFLAVILFYAGGESMRVISHDEISNLKIAPSKCYQWVSEMIAQKSSAILPPKISMKPELNVFCNVMPCIVRSKIGNFGGVKVVTRYPERQPSLDSLLLLFNADNGEFLALMDANWITAMRTGAVAAHSIKLLAKNDFSTIGIIGLGNTARATIAVLTDIMPNKHLQFKLFKYKGQEQLFSERFSYNKNYEFVFVNSYEDVVRGSDVVISAATYLSDDICSDDCFEEGVLVVPIHTRGFTNCDLFFDKVFADDTEHVCNFKHFDRFKYFAEVSEVVNGNKAGRENDNERILAYNIGVATHDVYFAAHIYEMLKDEELEQVLLKSPSDKFWL